MNKGNKMKIKLSDFGCTDGNAVLCPNCGEPYLHHEKVEIFERGEDEEFGIHAQVENGVLTTDTNLTGNPSARRHGMLIHFSCEGCTETSVLSLEQHKGTTYIEMKIRKN